MGTGIVKGVAFVLLVVGLLGLAVGILRYVTANEMAEATSGSAKAAGVANPALRNETLREGMQQEGLLFSAGGGVGVALGLMLLRRPRTGSDGGRPPSEVDRLVQELRSTRAEVRWKAAKRLGELKGAARSAGPALTEALNDPDGLVRAAAADALRAIG